MYNILFIAQYPNEKNIKDGMMQRIKNIDDIFKNINRTYLFISLKSNLKLKIEKLDKNITYVRLNYFLHHRWIKKFCKENQNIYIHSIYNFIKVQNYIDKNKNVILDVHGIVPEELYYNKDYIKYFIFNRIEKKAFDISTYQVFVTQSMENHFKKKYREINGIIYPILPSNLNTELNNTNTLEDNSKRFRKSLGFKNDDVVFIYSGNTQKWQNIDLMLQSIKKLKNDKYKFVILSRDIEVFKDKLKKYKIDNRQIILKSVQPDELKNYYSVANYGFVLRDNHLINKVACPTKLIEYMFFGIIPIVKSEEIGDFNKYKYDHIKVNQINDSMLPLKSNKNNEIIKKMYKLFEKSKGNIKNIFDI